MADFHRVVSIVELVSVAAAAAAVTIGAAVVRRRGGTPLYREQLPDADRAIRAKVWRALKEGYSGDPDIDALARRVATRTVRGGVTDRLMSIVIVLLAIPPLLHLLDHRPPWLTVSAQAFAVLVLSAIAVIAHVGRRRSRRYLHTE